MITDNHYNNNQVLDLWAVSFVHHGEIALEHRLARNWDARNLRGILRYIIIVISFRMYILAK